MWTQEQLREAFDAVADATDWRRPIAATCPATDRDLVAAAVAHFTATEAVFTDLLDGTLFVEAVGYRNGPAGP